MNQLAERIRVLKVARAFPPPSWYALTFRQLARLLQTRRCLLKRETA